MPEPIALGQPPTNDAPGIPLERERRPSAPWEGLPSEPGQPAIVNLTAAGAALLAQARADARGKATLPVLKGERQRALLVALTAGAGLAEHASPPAASLHVLSGCFRLSSADHEWVCGPAELVAIPPERHAVDCLEDGVFLLTVTPPGR